MTSLVPKAKKKRRRGSQYAGDLCAFCNKKLADVEVDLSMGRRVVPTPLCWTHFFTSRAVRQPDSSIRKIRSDESDESIKDQWKETGLQDLFGEAYIELQQELAEESARSFQLNKSDPLAGLLSQPKRKKPHLPKPPRPPKNDKITSETEGGFMRSIPLPERFQKTQRNLVEQHRRDARAAGSISAPPARNHAMTSESFGNPYQRRKPSRQSIWNMALDKSQKGAMDILHEDDRKPAPQSSGIQCSCGTSDVTETTSMSSRNNDMRKGETWGSKDRSDEVLTRYQCSACGKIWSERE